jgi:hypothetical protein
VLHTPEQLAIDQVYGEVPPLAVRAVLYGLDTVPLGRVLGEVIAIGVDVGVEVAGPIVTLSAAEAVVPFASVTAKVKVLVPAFTGVPDKTPDAVKPRPVLQEPEQCAIDQVYGAVPPLAAREAP